MKGAYFFAQDLAGNLQKVHVTRRPALANDSLRDVQETAAGSKPGAFYLLDDGSPVKRIDSDTFLVIGTGAYITMMRE